MFAFLWHQSFYLHKTNKHFPHVFTVLCWGSSGKGAQPPKKCLENMGLNCWDNGLWILGKENNFHSGTSQQWEEEPRSLHP